MRLRDGGEMRWLTLVVGAATLTAGIGLAVWAEGGEFRSTGATPRSGISVSENGSAEAGPRLEVEIKRQLGVFDLGKGRKVRLSAADTVDGMACLVEEADGGVGSSCLDSGFFASRKVEFLVSSQGGPDQFSALRIAGVAAPSIRAISLVRTDGTEVPVRLNSERAFVYESPGSDLEARIYPTALRLYGGHRTQAETVTFPPMG